MQSISLDQGRGLVLGPARREREVLSRAGPDHSIL